MSRIRNKNNVRIVLPVVDELRSASSINNTVDLSPFSSNKENVQKDLFFDERDKKQIDLKDLVSEKSKSDFKKFSLTSLAWALFLI